MKEYEYLKQQYPEHINGDSLHKICSISKRSASYLIEHGIIPAENTGKQTWRYKIALQDVIDYLAKRDKVGSMIPYGAATTPLKYRPRSRETFSNFVVPGKENELVEYFTFLYSEFPDVLRIVDIIEMTGLSDKTVAKYLHDGDIKSIANHPYYLVPKHYVVEFVSSRKYIDCKSCSESFKKILGGFRLWKNAK
jgi:hypothetical protein